MDRKNIGLYLLVGGLLTLVGGFAFSALTSGGGDNPPQQAQATPGVEETVRADVAPPLVVASPVPTVGLPTPVPTATPFETRLLAPTFTPIPTTPTATPRPATATPVPSTAQSSGGAASNGSAAPAPAAESPAGPAAAAAVTDDKKPVVPLARPEEALLAAHNKERERLKLEPLQIDATLTSAARHRARDMAQNNYFSHTSPFGETAFSVLTWAGYRYSVAGENIARNNYPESLSPGQAMAGFMASPDHYAAITNPSFNSVGVGFAPNADGMKYYVLIFANH